MTVRPPANEAATSMRRVMVTVIKVDLSGSTSLAEKLDAEDLRGVLASYFAALSREIRLHGGTVDKYIGDAVMAVFGLPRSQRGDAVRAVRAAIAMQEAIARENDELERRYGVRLSARIGVHTGELAGDTQDALDLIGETIKIAEQMEASAPLNAAVVSESTRRAAARAFSFQRLPPVTLKGRTQPIAAFRVVAPTRAVLGRTGRSGPISGTGASLQIADEKSYALQEERKVVTVLFADVAAPERSTGPLPEDEARLMLDAYFAAVAREIRHFGGTIDKYIGDAVMAVFGAPISHDDDGARAIGAALAIQTAIGRSNDRLEREHGVRLAVRIGVNTGEVVAGLLPGEVAAYTVTGDAVNTAQRIESVAPAGEVLVSETTRSLARTAFAYEAVAPLRLKGKSQPVPAYRVVGVAEAGTAIVADEPPLVGREVELGRLHESFERVRSGVGQSVHVYGEAGLGKTRLIGEFVSTLPKGTGLLRARCSSYESATPYAVVGDLFRRAFGIAAADDESTAAAALVAGANVYAPVLREGAVALLLEVLGYGERSVLPPEDKRRLLGSLLRELIVVRTDPASVVLVEDAHWIDPTSAELLREIRADIEKLRCLLITTSRDDAAPWPADQLPLQPLGSSDAALMVDRIAGDVLDPKARALVLERTGGNPFFIEEVVRSIRETGISTVPATVQDVLEARLDRLDEAPRLVAQRASIIGRTFWTRVLQRVTPLEDLDSPLQTLEADHFIAVGEIEPEPSYSFAHALVQEVAYRTQLISRRRHDHVAVGDAITELFGARLEEFVDVLAYHYDRGDDDAKALVALLRAADRAKRLYANDEALELYGAALRRARDGDGAHEAGTILERTGEVETLIGRYDQARASFENAASRVPVANAVTQARLLRKVARALQGKGAYPEALAVLRSGAEALRDADAVESARITLQTGQVHFWRGEYDDAERELQDAVRAGESVGADDLVAEGLKLLGNVANNIGDIRTAAELYQRSRSAYARLEDLVGVADVRSNLGMIYRRMGRWDESLEEYRASLALRERTGHLRGIAASHNNIGEVYRTRGEPAEAIPHYREAIVILERTGGAADAAVVLMSLGAAHVDSGDVATGLADLRAAEVKVQALGRMKYLPDLYQLIATGELASGDLAAARKDAERSLALAQAAHARHLEATARRILAEVALARGDLETARETIATSIRMLEELGEAAELARSRLVLARISG